MEVIYTKQALKSIKRLPADLRTRIVTGINKLPLGDIKKLQGYSNSYRLRIGDYRILFDMNEDMITIDNVLPRGEAYKE